MKKILVIDDDQDILELLTMRLMSKNYAVVSADDGMKGIERVYSEKPDLILLDIMMPQMDGVEVIKALKNTPHVIKQKTPIIMLTAQNDLTVKLWFQNQEIYDFVTKPFDDALLLDKIKTCLGE